MHTKPFSKHFPFKQVFIYTVMTMAVFIVVSLITLFMLGYRVDTDKGNIERYAFLQFSSSPSGATVSVDGNITGVRSTTKRIVRSMDVARSKSISRFAPNTPAKPVKPALHVKKDVPKPVKHPLATKVEKMRSIKKTTAHKKPVNKPAKVIKDEAINEAMAKTDRIEPPKNKNFIKRHYKYLNILTVGILLIIALGYFVYLNLPNISVMIASAQAGIKATYPEYVPDGYGMDGPVSFSEGEVVIKFHANTGDTSFTIKQSKSSWDSSAVKMYVDKESKGDTVETKEGGRTIYTYNNNTRAAWVNGGILYTITGDAKLSGEQIRHIATSL